MNTNDNAPDTQAVVQAAPLSATATAEMVQVATLLLRASAVIEQDPPPGQETTRSLLAVSLIGASGMALEFSGAMWREDPADETLGYGQRTALDCMNRVADLMVGLEVAPEQLSEFGPLLTVLADLKRDVQRLG